MMSPVFEFLEPAASTVFDSLVRASFHGGVFILLVWVACRLLPRLPASVRCTLWWLASVKLLVAFVCVDPLPLPVLAPMPPGTEMMENFSSIRAVTVVGEVPAGMSGARAAKPMPAFSWSSLAVGVWGAILTLLVAALALRMRTIGRIAERAVDAPPQVRELAAGVCRLLDLKQTPAVRFSDEVDTPLVLGFRNPVVLLPAVSFTALQPEQRRMALCHELMHLRRSDLWLACIPALTERLFFFHPLAHLAVREYQLTREAACDSAVIRNLNAPPGDYGRLLLTLGVSRLPIPVAAAGSPSSYSKLKRRITMLRDITNYTPRLRTISWAIVLVATLAIAPFALVARSQEREQPARAPVATRPAATPTPAITAPTAAVPALAVQPTSPSAQPAKAQSQERERRLNYVLFLDSQRTMMSGSSADTARAKSFREGNEQMLWFRRGEREYVVRDPALLGEVEQIFRPLQEIGGEQAKIGSKQAEIGGRQAEIGKQQAAVGRKQAEIGARQAKIGSRQASVSARQGPLEQEMKQLEQEMDQLEREMEELSAEMQKLNTPMGDLSKDMNALSEEMNVLSRKMEEAAAKAEADMDSLLDRAISTGAATEVK